MKCPQELQNLLHEIQFNKEVVWNSEKSIRDGAASFKGIHIPHQGENIFYAHLRNYKFGIDNEWNNIHELSDEGRERATQILNERLEENKKRKDEAQKNVAIEVGYEFLRFSTNGETPYMKLKKIEALYGAKIDETKNNLVVPIADVNGKIQSLQYIFPEKINGTNKIFKTGGKTKGCFHALGELRSNKPIYICEGFATAASVQMVLGDQGAVVSCFYAKNLLPVAKELRSKYPSAKIIVCADNDAFTEIYGKPVNVGVEEAKKATQAIGAEIRIPKFAKPTKSKSDFNDLYVEEGAEVVLSQLVEIIPVNKTNPGVIKFTSLKELIDKPLPATNYIIEGLLIDGGTSLVSAKPKVGKTTLVRQLSLAVATGRTFLGRKTKKGPVFYLAVEENEVEVRKHFVKMGASGSEDIYIYAAAAPKDTLDQLEKIIPNFKPKPSIIVFDTLFRVVRAKDGNAYSEVTDLMGQIQDFARRNKVHVLLVHHASKSDKEGMDAVLGSTAIYGGVDTPIMMTRENDKRYFQTDQRYGESVEKTELLFDKEKGTMSLGRTRRTNIESEVETRIIGHLQSCPEPVPEKEILRHCKGKKAVLGSVLRGLVAVGIVIRSGREKGRGPYLYKVVSEVEQKELRENMIGIM